MWSKDCSALFRTPSLSDHSSQDASIGRRSDNSSDASGTEEAESQDQGIKDAKDTSWAPFSSLEVCLCAYERSKHVLMF
jgi:hypothetical protein